jgi:hypothetical protein
VKLALLADIDENVRSSTLALAQPQREQLDQIVVLGDVFATGTLLGNMVALLAEADAIGV